MSVHKIKAIALELPKKRWTEESDAIDPCLESSLPSASGSKTVDGRKWKLLGIQTFPRENFREITPVIPDLAVDESLRVREESRGEDCDFRATRLAGRRRHVLKYYSLSRHRYLNRLSL
jgi:hypothetical protein